MVVNRKYGCFALVLLIPTVVYIWSLWYYGGLYQSGRLLSASQVTADTLASTFFQNFIVNLPELLAAVITLALLRWNQFVRSIGLNVRNQKKMVLPLAAGACLLVLIAAFLFTKLDPLAVGYLWVYFLLLVAFTEEITFRGLLPYLMEKGGAPIWAIWIIPGVLFACMHTLMPLIQNGLTTGAFVCTLLFTLGGYTAGHCGFYALRRWSGTLWLPVLIHGLLDFSTVFIK